MIKDSYKDLLGQRFGILKVDQLLGFYNNKNGSRTSKWKCICDCGNITEVRGNHLCMGRIKSCGCLRLKNDINGKKIIGQGAFNRLYRTYIYRAKKRQIDFNLTSEEFYNIVQRNCFYCGLKPSQLFKNYNCSEDWNEKNPLIYNGIDRQNNNIGYTIENSVACCKYCNRAKDTMSLEEFKDWITRVYNHSIGDK